MYSSSRRARGPASRFTTVWILASAAFVSNLDARAIVPLLPNLAEDLGISVASAGLIVTAYMLPYGLFQVVYGPLGDRVGRLPVARATLFVFSLAALSCSLAGSLDSLAVLRSLAGAAAAALFPTALAYVGDTFEYRDRPAAISVLMTATSTAQVISLALGGILAGFVGWRVVFVLNGALGFVALAGLFRLRSEPREAGTKAGSFHAYSQLLRLPQGWALVCLGLVDGAFLLGGVSYLGALLREEWRLPYPVVGLVLACYGVATLVASRFLAWIARRYGEITRFGVGMAGCGVGFVIVANLPRWEFAPLAIMVIGFGFTVGHTVLQARSTEVIPSARGTSVAVFACSLFLGGAAGTATIGAMIAGLGYVRALSLLGFALGIFAAIGAYSLARFSGRGTGRWRQFGRPGLVDRGTVRDVPTRGQPGSA